MTAQIEDGSGNDLDTTYFRYFTPTSQTVAGTEYDNLNAPSLSTGYVHGLRSIFSNTAFARLVAFEGSAASAEAAADSTVQSYADLDFQYTGGPNGTWVTGAEGTGGLNSIGYSYTFNTASGYTNGYSRWAVQTTESAANGGSITIASNYQGETLLKDQRDSTSLLDFYTAYLYSSSGQLQEIDNPSAISSASLDTSSFIVDLTANTSGTTNIGLVQRIEYGGPTTTATASTAGDAQGYVKDHFVQEGLGSSPSTWTYLDYTQYFQVTAGSVTVDPVASTTLFSQEMTTLATSGTGVETTTYGYSFFTSSVAIQQTTVTSPSVTDQVSSGTSVQNAVSTVVNLQGLPVWTKDARGTLTYKTFDLATSAMTEEIDDVNTGSTYSSEYSGLPSGWSNTAGLNLITTFGIDSLGRLIEFIDPNLNTTFVRYRDPQHEVRTYKGWLANSARTSFSVPSGETLPPTEVAITDLTFTSTTAGSTTGNSYSESFTMAAAVSGYTDSSGAPLGTEPISAVTSLSLLLAKNTAQYGESDAYYSIPSISGRLSSDGLTLYGIDASTARPIGTQWTTSSTDPSTANYYATTFATTTVDQTTVTDPNGSAVTTKFDSMGRVIEVDRADPIYGTGITTYEYDHDSTGDSNVTKITAQTGVSSTIAPDQITAVYYDWRDRETAVKQGVESSLSAETSDMTTVLPVTFYTLNNLGQVTSQYLHAGSGMAISDSTGTVLFEPPGSLTFQAYTASPVAALLRAKKTYVYDNLNRVQSQSVFTVNQSTGSVGSSHDTSWLYDGDNNVTRVQDPLTNKTTFVYDAVNRLTQELAPNPSTGSDSGTRPTTTWTYTGVLLTGVQDPNGNTKSYGG